ncbi:MAG: pyridoxamine 5'-phosphate oxidase family protein [bacterium]|nr:pyridoxamine 5'-phosphate oxidase family protein [bacterium]
MMRRIKQEITDRLRIEKIIKNAKVCRLGLSLNNKPYVVPIVFGYKDNTLYIHSSRQGKGRKTEIIKQNNNVCFELEGITKIIEDDLSCKWDVHYQTIIGFGTATFIEKIEEKIEALDIIMKHYTNNAIKYSETYLNVTTVIKIEIEEMSAKQNGYPELSK